MRQNLKNYLLWGGLCFTTLVACQDDNEVPNLPIQPDTESTNPDHSVCQTYRDFLENNEHNVLLDFSYAGYAHGEVAPPSVDELRAKGYKVYNVTDYGAVSNDGKSDREAFFKTLEAAGAKRTRTKDGNIRFTAPKNRLNAIIHFPKGIYSLQENDEEVNQSIHLTMGNFVICGAGRDKTFIQMNKQNQALSPNKMWSTPVMLEVKHYSDANGTTAVRKDADKGTFTIEVATTNGFAAGDYVRLYLKNNDPKLLTEELAPHSLKELNPSAAIIRGGVEVLDYHQIKKIEGNKITFYEPLMHEVKAQWNWRLQKFPHYEQVGIEDLCFEGHAKKEFKHHGSASDDGAYKLIDLMRLSDSWMRRVDFKSVSETASIVNCANVSVYDIRISGNRGHSAIRSQGSSRVFIGKVKDNSDGNELLDSGGHNIGGFMTNAGQYHACGVSKHSMGAVIWRVRWGDDSCFESHATQPRATLIDACTGGFMQWREGGDIDQLPNHLNDLIIWNMNATRTKAGDAHPFIWWNNGNGGWWKNLPPVIVGFHGAPIQWDESPKQLKRLESNGQAVEPASLYEAQLQRRLGYVPAWLSALK